MAPPKGIERGGKGQRANSSPSIDKLFPGFGYVPGSVTS
jgi:hypothetical protein